MLITGTCINKDSSIIEVSDEGVTSIVHKIRQIEIRLRLLELNSTNDINNVRDLGESAHQLESISELESNSGALTGFEPRNGSWSSNMHSSICKRIYRELGSHTSSGMLHGLELLNVYNESRKDSGLAPVKLGDLLPIVNKEWKKKQDDTSECFTDLSANSGEIHTGSSAVTASVPATTEEVLAFDTDVIAATAENALSIDSTQLSAVDTSHTELGAFLSRPVQIRQYELKVGELLTENFRPWSDFLSTLTVNKKIENYSLLRGKLHLRFLVNGGPTYYGKLIAAYNPYDSSLRPNNIKPTLVFDSARGVRLTKMSQRPHVIIDPTESSGGDIECPFVYPFNYMDITQGSPDPNAMGEVDMQSISALGSTSVEGPAQSSDVAVTITIFAWMSEVTLAAPTSAPPLLANSGLDPNSAQVEDEYGKGIISRPASALARMMGRMSSIPTIGPYATATGMVASGVSDLASLFGYCRPMSVKAPEQYRPTYMGNLANTDIEEAGCKLTFDAKQELTIDHNIIGRQTEDELNVLSIAKRESFVDTFAWNGTSSPGTVLAKINVTPTVMPKHNYNYLNLDNTELGLTALAYASLPFTYWRGGLRYRFMVQCSAFHRGRLRITYDPNSDSGEDAASNAVYTRIVDIGQNRDFTLDVNWMQAQPYRFTDQPTATEPGMLTDYTPAECSLPVRNATVLNRNIATCNGQITIEVLNNLVSPLQTDTLSNNIEVAWFISACDDFEVAGPGEAFGNLQSAYTREVTNLTPNAGEVLDANSGLAGASTVAQKADTGDILALEPIGTMSDFSAMSMVHFGETFSSFRKMMKRYTFYEDVPLPARAPTAEDDQNFLFRFTTPMYPLAYGVNPYGPYNNPEEGFEDSFDFTVARNSLMTYLAKGFVARRGGVRWKYMITSPTNTDLVRELRVARTPYHFGSVLAGTRIARLNPTPASSQLQAQDLMANATNEFGGSYITPSQQNPTAEVELPFYSNYRFHTGPDSSVDQTQVHKVEAQLHNVGAINNGILRSYVAAAEDFNLSWFINAPSMYYQGFAAGTS
ncbi:hypothetical protein 2 [Beihai picorna-like virus 26]|uniref:hypothetical protein 2 n=1 Tax=Beihai picorna-like virus 26 TaxID=1922569 RepID=UPI00090AE2D9|nr:hypothetical protein 2 [Beihai picorna-like virus 26]APG78983.1 hypothetical protein 2 [Beihai picorna-like virus 26]